MASLTQSNGALTTVGSGTLTASLLLGSNINRSGPTGAFADTFDTVANIQAALNQSASGFGGAAWRVLYVNTTAYVATLTAPAGLTLNGASAAIPAASSAWLLVSVTTGGAVTVTVLYRVSYS